MKFITLLLTVLLVFALASFALAENDTTPTPKLLADHDGHVMMGFTQPSAFCKQFIQETGLLNTVLPNVVPYKNEVFNFYTFDNQPIGYVQLIDRKVSAVDCGENKAPTYKVSIKSEDVVNSIMNSQDPFGEFQKQKKEHNIKIVGESFGKKVKGGFINILAGIASWFM